ncbi:MAG: hypothetical protein AAB355_02325 [Patescibacteria group bacterium]
MIEYTNEQLEQAIAALPEEFRGAIASSFISDKSLEIGRRHNLHIDQLSKMKDITMLALLNLIDTSKFSETLIEELSISLEEASSLVNDVNSEIFEGLRKLIREKTTEEENLGEVSSEEAPISPMEIAPAAEEKEEKLNRDDVLHGIENPTPAVPSLPVVVTPQPATINGQSPIIPSGEPAPASSYPLTSNSQTKSIPEQKLAAPFGIPASVTSKEENSIASIKKMDPYREPV